MYTPTAPDTTDVSIPAYHSKEEEYGEVVDKTVN